MKWINQIERINQPTNQPINQSINFIFYQPNKYFHIFVAADPEAGDPIPAFEDVTHGATETSGDMC